MLCIQPYYLLSLKDIKTLCLEALVEKPKEQLYIFKEINDGIQTQDLAELKHSPAFFSIKNIRSYVTTH